MCGVDTQEITSGRTLDMVQFGSVGHLIQISWTWLLTRGTVFADTIQPLSSEKHVVEGKNVTLSCNYSATTGNVNSLQWYRQYLGAKPEFLLFVTEYSSSSEPDLRLYSKATKAIKRVDLEISSAEVSDSAVYYCALQPTVTGNTRILYKNLIHSDTMAQSITPQANRTLASVGQKAILSCKYEGSITNLHWYRQYSRSKPEFLAWIYPHGTTSDPLPPRILPKVDKNLVSLEIFDAEVSDSALYYCALTPTIFPNPNISVVEKRVFISQKSTSLNLKEDQ
ncbi:hypothetical protein F2P79_019581 [Pimephales promelas]|nr:hypothetical protein F2P79_019581 [Pimephales promelas]